MAPKTMIRIGQVSSRGRQLLMGLTPSFLYSSAVFWFSFSLSLAYFRCSSASLGCRVAVFRMPIRLFRSRGVMTARISRVKITMAHPQLPTQD